MNDLVLRVLLIEDDKDDYTLVDDLLSELTLPKIILDWVMTYDAALEEIGRCQHDIYLLDYRLGERNGLELLREVIDMGCDAPIIFLTGQGDYDVDVEAMKAGAADYLVKDQISADLLERSIRYSMERRRAQDALRKSERRFRMLVETMNEGLGIQDENGSFTYVNEKLCEMLNYSREELIGKPVTDLIDNANLILLQQEIARRKLGERASYEIELLAKDGRKVPTIVSSSPIFDRDGTFIGGIAAITDLSVIKECRQNLEHMERKAT